MRKSFHLAMFFAFVSAPSFAATATRDQVNKIIQEKKILPSTIRLESGEQLFLEYGADGTQFCYSGGLRIKVSGYVDKKNNKIVIDQNVNPNRCPSMD